MKIKDKSLKNLNNENITINLENNKNYYTKRKENLLNF